MQNRWDPQSAATFLADDTELGLRVYSSQLLGQDEDLVLHGGGNTSVKGIRNNVFGDQQRILNVKGSGWDLRTIEAAGFPAVDLDYLLRLGDLPQLSDTEMMKQLRLALLDPTAPAPSVEAILHALIPFAVVDHSHADAVVAISNSPDGELALREIYGKRVLILPYIMPGFILARQVAEATRDIDWQTLEGIILLHHGIFTFSDEARVSYDNMISLVSEAESYLQSVGAIDNIARGTYQPDAADCLGLSRLRKQASQLLGAPALLRWDISPEAVGFASLDNVGDIATRGPLTPDHTIHAKAFAAVFDDEPEAGLKEFVRRYQDYFRKHASSTHQCLDSMPRYGVWLNRGVLSFAPGLKRLQVVSDITRHTIRAIQWGQALGGWEALPQKDLFDVEYWELEQAKLKSTKSVPEFEGKVVLVTGAASGIGRACVNEFTARGAAVVALDIAKDFSTAFDDHSGVLALRCDVTDSDALDYAVRRGVRHFGGIDVVVSNAGNFPASCEISNMDDQSCDNSLKLNLSSHMKLLRVCTPYLEQGIEPAVVIMGSKNVPAPGPGAAAYSVAKAGLTQMARVAALELGQAGIRVNVLHPNGVFDTAIWTDEVLAHRAQRYGMSVEDYKRNNVLQCEVTSTDVASMVVLFAGSGTGVTTGAQVPVDGGNERVI
ncbi:MAG: bifunctional aldolase/short-chain dehydrogenase [Gammaproteobacteria bacterium]|nr:bifunctional aldolase/short-chain dehydrogenase [Gammaproteobacteria bacterium]